MADRIEILKIKNSNNEYINVIVPLSSGGTGVTTLEDLETLLGTTKLITNVTLNGTTLTVTFVDGTSSVYQLQDTKYSLPTATKSTLGGVKIGSNITSSSGSISLTKNNVTTALGYTPLQTQTGISFNSTVSVTASTQAERLAEAATINKTGGSYTTYDTSSSTGSGDCTRTQRSFVTTNGIAAGSYALKTLLQQLVNKSHRHTHHRYLYDNECNCDCSDEG